MPTLANKTATNKLEFDIHVTKNARFEETTFTIENGMSSPLFQKYGNKLRTPSAKVWPAGTKLNILHKKLYSLGGMKLAFVKIGGTKGYLPISKIRKPVVENKTKWEDEAIEIINRTIIDVGRPIDIKIRGDSKIFSGISYAIKVDNRIKSMGGVPPSVDPKTDFILCQDKAKPLDRTSIFISHKKHGGADAFQQYGGLSLTAGRHINNHKMVQRFLSNVVEALNDVPRLEVPLVGNFRDTFLANAAIFGSDFGKAFSLNHVNCIGQGRPILKPISGGKYFELSFSHHLSTSGNISHFTGDYLPVLGASYRSGRSFMFQGKRYEQTRLGFYPRKKIQTSNAVVIDL
jgi:hypothetical protein